MKKFLLVLSFLFCSSAIFAQSSTLTAFNAKAYDKANAAEDTSTTLTIGAYPYVILQTTSTGSDSTTLVANVDAFINGLWVNTITTQTLTLGRPTSHIVAASKGQVNYTTLRAPATELLGGATNIRIRNKHSAFANGSTDSSSALTYTQKVFLRKP